MPRCLSAWCLCSCPPGCCFGRVSPGPRPSAGRRSLESWWERRGVGAPRGGGSPSASPGRGPPRRLVVEGPYRIVRTPMYIGAGLALAGAALFYQSCPLLGYTGLFFLATHLFVVGYEEPTLRRTFGGEYEAYCRRGGRGGARPEKARAPPEWGGGRGPAAV